MAGGFSSQWRTMGSNTNGSVDPGTSGGGSTGIGTTPDEVSNASNGGTNNQVRKEVTMWLVDGDNTYTPNMNWAINSNFTIVCNATGQTLAGDPGNVEVAIEGSVDNTNFVEMVDTGDWDAGTTDMGSLVYDYATNGKMPFMRIRLNGDAVDNSAKPFKVCVFMHGE
jgi:hypothetical protein